MTLPLFWKPLERTGRVRWLLRNTFAAGMGGLLLGLLLAVGCHVFNVNARPGSALFLTFGPPVALLCFVLAAFIQVARWRGPQ